MTAISVKKPFSLKTATVEFTPVDEGLPFDFSDHINQVTFNPNSSTGTFTSVSGKTVSDISASLWTVDFGLIQDLEANGFVRWLLEHEGEKFVCDVTFANGTDPCQITVTARAAALGGTANGDLATSTVTLPADGKPEFATP